MRQDQTNWDEWVPTAVYVYNTTVHTTTAYVPFELVYGCRSELPSALTVTPNVKYNYENKGVAVLYNTAWRNILYVNLNKIDNQTLVLRQYVHHVDIVCQMTVIRNLTGCAHFSNDAREHLNQLTRTGCLLKETTGQQTGGKRKKRGVLNFIVELIKILFGTVDEDDVKYCIDQIKLFEQNSKDMNTSLKQQLYAVRSSLGAVNNTLADAEYNESLVKEGINRVTKYMNTLKSETNEKMNLFSAKIEIEGHTLRANNAINTLQRNFDLSIDNVTNAKKGCYNLR